MSSDPKKPGFDAPPPGTPDLLQKDLSLDRRRRVPTFEELQAAPTDPVRPATPRPPPGPIPQGTVPARPSNLESTTQTVEKLIPPGLQARQPALQIRTPTPPTQPGRPLAIPPPPPPQARPPMPPPAPQTNAIPVRTPVPPQPPRAPMPPPPQPATQPARPPVAAAMPATQPARMPVPPRPAPPPLGAVDDDGTNVLPALAPPRTAPPSPTEFAQARPAVMPQVTPSTPMQGAVVPEGQQTPQQRSSHAGVKPALPPRVVHDEPEPLTVPAAQPRSFTPPPAPAAPPVPRPAALPPEMLVTQPGMPGPFQARGMPHPQAIPQRPPSMPELPRVQAKSPVFAAAQFEAALLPAEGGTVTAEPAWLWRRTGAWLTDLLVVGGVVLGFLAIAMTIIAPKNLSPLQQLLSVALPGLALAGILAFVYATLFAFLWSGRTPGRRLFGIHLVDSTGHAPGPARALIRAVLSLVSFGLFLSGFWLALFDRHGQTLHDKLTRTFVVKLQDA